MSGIDLNRAGTPLLEVVSEPDIRSPAEAVTYLRTLPTLVRYLDICDGNMQEGSFRCDANVSIRPQGQKQLGTRTELKNINSFRFVEQALHYEIERQLKSSSAAGKSAKRHVFTIQFGATPEQCVVKKRRMITATFPIRTCRHLLLMMACSRKRRLRYQNSQAGADHALFKSMA